MTITSRKVLAGLVAAGALTLANAAPAGAQHGPGFSLCQAVPASGMGVSPAGGPGYNFEQPPPAAQTAFDNVCGPI